MKILAVILLLTPFLASAKTEKGVIANVLPDKLILSMNCEARTNLHAKKPFLFYTCKNLNDGKYFMEFRLNDSDIAASFRKNSPDVVINESLFKSYTLYEIGGKNAKGEPLRSAHYCTKDLCLDLVADYEVSVKESITSQLKK